MYPFFCLQRDLQRLIVAVFASVARASSLHARIVADGILDSVTHLTQLRTPELTRPCAATIRALSHNPDLHDRMADVLELIVDVMAAKEAGGGPTPAATASASGGSRAKVLATPPSAWTFGGVREASNEVGRPPPVFR